MRRSVSTAPGFLLWLALLALTLRPLPPVERALDLALSPLRLLAEVTFPVVLLRQQRVRAAEERLAADAPREASENERLLSDLAQSALPTDPRLLAGRRIVHAEVLGRAGDQDHLRVRLRDRRGVRPGLPVAFGDVYVGRVLEVPAAGSGTEPWPAEPVEGVAVVEIVTAAGFHVGARIAPEHGASAAPGGSAEVLLTVGGVRSRRTRRSIVGSGRRQAEIRLAVHHPSDSSGHGRLARVHELFDEEGDYAELAEGLVLGRLAGGELEEPWIAPEIDYLDGLFHVVVLCPPEPTLGSALPFETVLRDTNWVRTRPLNLGDPSPERSACRIRMGSLHGIVPGAAVTSVGAQLVGRVRRVAPLVSDVSFLDDPGFSVVAVARFEGDDEPRVLGRLDALGRDPRGRGVRFRWTVRVSLGDLPVSVREAATGEGLGRARLFTGSGDPGLPAGFAFGEALVPLDAAPGEERVIEIWPDVPSEELHGLFVRTAGVTGVPSEERRP